MNYIKDKVIIIDDEKFNVYKKEVGNTHQYYLDEFAKEKGYEYSSMEYLAKKGNFVFEIAGPIDNEYFIIGYMPKDITDMQLYYLELMSETFDNVSLFEGIKLTNDSKEYYSSKDKEISSKEYFYNEVIESYFHKEKKLK